MEICTNSKKSWVVEFIGPNLFYLCLMLFLASRQLIWGNKNAIIKLLSSLDELKNCEQIDSTNLNLF